MIDFKELDVDGIKFEQLVRELLIREGFETHWTGVGPDGGRDLVITEKFQGSLSNYKRKWLISCKHFAHSGNSVGREQVGNIVEDCRAIGAEGYILVCSTQPSASLVTRLEEIKINQGILTLFWDVIEIEKRISRPNTFSLIHTFFPKSAKNYKWQIYNVYSPSFWAANYKDYFFYMSSRDATTFPELKDVETMVTKIESIPLHKDKEYSWNDHYLRLRAVYFDNKHESYVVFVDYIFPRNIDKNKIMKPAEINKYLNTGMGLYSDKTLMWKLTDWDVKYVPASTSNDHFHLDHKDYYEPYMNNFESGSSRSDFFDDWLRNNQS